MNLKDIDQLRPYRSQMSASGDTIRLSGGAVYGKTGFSGDVYMGII